MFGGTIWGFHLVRWSPIGFRVWDLGVRVWDLRFTGFPPCWEVTVWTAFPTAQPALAKKNLKP